MSAIPTFSSFDDFAASLADSSRILAVDYGKARVGVAISDGLRSMAHPHSIIAHKKFTAVAESLFMLLDEYACNHMVIGLPLHVDGRTSPMAQAAMQFGRNLLKLRPELHILLEDERFSSEKAKSMQLQKRPVDAAAAAVILTTVLERL